MKPGLGFTLVELMVTVTISAILFGGGIAAYRGIGNKQTVKQAGTTFQSNLRLFQQKALASEKPAECGLNKLEGFEVSYVSNSSYSIRALCGTGTATIIILADDVKFSEDFNTIIFQVLKSEVSGSQTITLSKGNFSYQVVIESGGVIRGQQL